MEEKPKKIAIVGVGPIGQAVERVLERRGLLAGETTKVLELAESLANMTVQEVQEVSEILKNEYGVIDLKLLIAREVPEIELPDELRPKYKVNLPAKVIRGSFKSKYGRGFVKARINRKKGL